MPRLTILPSPSQDILLARYDPSTYPIFRTIFRRANADDAPVMRMFLQDPDEEAVSVIQENRSQKAITAIRYEWSLRDTEGKTRSRIQIHDSYLGDPVRPVVEAGGRHLLTPSGGISEQMVQEIARGSLSGCFGGSGSKASLANVTDVTFAIQFVLFADGEIAGPDPQGYAIDLRMRAKAAGFVAFQVRKAEKDGRDPEPVLAALAELPRLQGDHMAPLVANFAQRLLAHCGNKGSDRTPVLESLLKHYENLPLVPRFYRSDM